MMNEELEKYFDEVMQTGDMSFINEQINNLNYEDLEYLVTKFLIQRGNENV